MLAFAACMLVLSFMMTFNVLLGEYDLGTRSSSGRHKSLQSLRKNRNDMQQSLQDFAQPNDKKEFVRYSERHQSNEEKLQATQKLLDKKRNELKRLQMQDLLEEPNRNSLRDTWQTFRDNQITVKDENGVRIGYRPTVERRRRYPKILFFLHIHKSAGSTFCRQAYLNRMAANYKQNCNVQADQRCCGQKDTVQAQIDYANQTHYDLVASEQEMYDSMAPESYDYIVSLRDSQRRYCSHWNHLLMEAKKNREHELELLEKHEHHYPLAEAAMEWAQESIRGRNGESNVIAAQEDPIHWNYTVRDYNGIIYPVGNYTKWLQGQPDNYNVRMICGVKCSRIPKYQLSHDVFRYTIDRLAKFAHIIFVEDMEASFARFAKAYGWQYNVATTGQRRMNAFELTEVLETHTEGWDPFMSVLDDALYELAQRKYEEATDKELLKMIDDVEFANKDMVEEYFTEGPKKGCSNECCGICSKW